MRRSRLLRPVFMAAFAFAIVGVSSASATEPSGILYLPGEEGPVSFKGTGKGGTLSTTGLLKAAITAASVKIEGELGKGEGTHSTHRVRDT